MKTELHAFASYHERDRHINSIGDRQLYRTGRYGVRKDLEVFIIHGSWKCDRYHQLPDTPKRIGRHFLGNPNAGAYEVVPMLIGCQTKVRRHARSKRCGQEICGGERLAFSVIVDGSVGDHGCSRWTMGCGTSKVSVVPDVDLYHCSASNP